MQQQSIPKAALWMAGWLAAMLGMTVAGREASLDVDPFQIMELRSLLGLMMLAPLIWWVGGLRAMRSARPWQHVGRNAVHYVGQYLWLAALSMIPIAQLVAIEFTLPIWTALLAAAFLGERLTARKTVAVALGLAGVAAIVRPSAETLDLGHIYALGAAAGFAVSIIMVKSLTRTEGVTSIVFWMLAVQAVIGLPPALAVWTWPPAAAWPWLAAIAFFGTFSHYCMARAMVHAEASVVTPMDFLRVPLSALLGWLVYTEALDAFTILGAALILLGNAANLRRPSPTGAKPEAARQPEG
jgi:drug/metabolite transporter (DMT)-like permease